MKISDSPRPLATTSAPSPAPLAASVQTAPAKPTTASKIALATAQTTSNRYFSALEGKNAEAMIGLYANDARFSDPVVGELRMTGDVSLKNMYRAQFRSAERGGSLQSTVDRSSPKISPDGKTVTFSWTARYQVKAKPSDATGRPVENRITTTLHLDADGKIARQTDAFDFKSWIRQAVGGPAAFASGLPFIGNVVHQKAKEKALALYRAEG